MERGGTKTPVLALPRTPRTSFPRALQTVSLPAVPARGSCSLPMLAARPLFFNPSRSCVDLVVFPPPPSRLSCSSLVGLGRRAAALLPPRRISACGFFLGNNSACPLSGERRLGFTGPARRATHPLPGVAAAKPRDDLQWGVPVGLSGARAQAGRFSVLAPAALSQALYRRASSWPPFLHSSSSPNTFPRLKGVSSTHPPIRF